MANINLEPHQHERLRAILLPLLAEKRIKRTRLHEHIEALGLKDGSETHGIAPSQSTIHRQLLGKGSYDLETLILVLRVLDIEKGSPLFDELTTLHEVPKPAVTSQDTEAGNDDQSEPRESWKKLLPFAVGAVAVVVTLAAMLLSGVLPLSEKDRAMRELQDRGASLSTASLTSMLETGDIELLELATTAGLTRAQMADALRTAGLRFFETVDGNPAFVGWFEKALQDIIDPEQRVIRREREVGLLTAAFFAGNAEAMIAIMNAGGSAHGYQDFQGVFAVNPFFLFPAHNVATSSNFTEAEKTKILAAMMEAGLSVYRQIEDVEILRPFQTGDSTNLDARDNLPVVTALADIPLKQGGEEVTASRDETLCRVYEARSDTPWCEHMRRVPTYLGVVDQGQGDLMQIFVRDLIGVSDGKMYFYLTHVGSIMSINGLLEVAENRSDGVLHFRGQVHSNGRGLCDGDTTYRTRDDCWLYYNVRGLDGETAVIEDHWTTRIQRASE